jgi:hypothetical protein
MKFSNRLLTIVACLTLLAGMPFLAGCGDKKETVTQPPPPPPPPPPTTGTISGVAALPPGLPGDLGNARVGLFTSLDNWNADIPARPFSRVVGSGPSVQIMETGVTPGSYFVEVWSDVNHDAVFNAGDWWAVTGTPTWPVPTPSFVMVSAGGNTIVQLYLIAIP